MKALVVIDAQNEFSEEGQRAVPDHVVILGNILKLVHDARQREVPIAWVRHFNRPDETPAFVQGTWGAEFSADCGPLPDTAHEHVFEKDVFGAFTGTGLAKWLEGLGIQHLQIAGFYSHMCVSTTAREALMRGYHVFLDIATTGACSLKHPLLGEQSAEEVRRSALLQLSQMGAVVGSST